MRRLLDTCGSQPFLLRAGGAPRAGRYFDPTFAAGVRASAAKAISARARAARLTPGPAARAWCDEKYLSPPAFGPPRSHACARMSGTADRHRGVARRLRSLAVFGPTAARHRRSRRARSRATHGRARVSSRLADSRRASRASARSLERRRSESRGARGRSRVPRLKRVLGLGNGSPAARRARGRGPGASEAAFTGTRPDEDSGLAAQGGG
jgi:hypothetical protein